MGDAFKPERFTLTPERLAAFLAADGKRKARRYQRPSKQVLRRRPFLAGPVPLDLLQPVFDHRCGLSTMWVLLLLWHCRTLRPGSFTSQRLRQFGVDRQMKRRALHALEKLGLVIIERRSSRNPRVTLLDPFLQAWSR
jgi:hypothetical protein